MSSSDVSNKEILNKVDSYAKMAGICATYAEMVIFQDRNKIPNGDEFIHRFLISETTRLQLPSNTNVGEFCIEVVIRDYQVISNSYK
ncbi:hypothetical protein KT999_15200 [Proteus mirabilis]|uniref:hypothetical protein n=1 Tax=Proteus mirabilis TaxID=584 RepID=UPI00218234E3|nr:hypothetical protein [Proteus mirabilis]MCT0100388.1 hypothetical protein [Proteus mirabilis]